MSPSTSEPPKDTEQYEAVLHRLQKFIGVLGLLLPTLIFAFHGKLLASISHYYYTTSSIFFTGILSCFGLILLAYKGYKPDDEEKISDNTITSIAGFFALVAVIVPTCCSGSGDDKINCTNVHLQDYLFGHVSTSSNTIHLLSAAIFILLLGWMCVYKFTRSKTAEGQSFHKFYRICGYVVWASVGLIGLLFAYEEITKTNFDDVVHGYTFILESVALYAFAVAWLVKGNISEDVRAMRQRILKK